jgi:hypothetical protein
MEAIEVAFNKALLVTLTGSIMPASSMSTNSSSKASYPKVLEFLPSIVLIISSESTPAFVSIWVRGAYRAL